MRIKTIFAGLIFIAFTIVSCAGNNQAIKAMEAIETGDSQDSSSLHSETVLKTETKTETAPSQEEETLIEEASSPAEQDSEVQPFSSEPSLVQPIDTISDSTPKEIPERSLPDSAKKQAATPQKEFQPEQKEEEIVFNFDNADIHEVINTVGDILGLNYIVDPRVTGKVNIHTKGKIAKKDLFAVLESLLKINKFTIIKKGQFYHIVSLQTLKQDYLPSQLSLDEEGIPLTDTFIIQIVPLKFVSAEAIVKTIKPLISPAGLIIPRDNLLVLLDSSANIKKLLTIVELFDEDVFNQVQMQLYEAENVDVEDIAKDLEAIFQAFEVADDSARAGGITFVPISRINMLLVVSSNDQLLEKAVQWASKIDAEVSETTVKIHVYYAQNGKAVDIADVLTQVFKGEKKEKETAFRSKLLEKKTASKETELSKNKPVTRRSTVRGEATETVVGDVEIVVDEVNNALIIRATERDYRVVEKTIKKLDIYPKQVLIEVLIAEIRLDDEMKLGVEWQYMNEIKTGYNYTATSTGLTSLAEEITSGLTYVVDKTDRFKSTLKAYAAKDKANILSSPHIIASDNKEASINITEEIPIVSGQVTTTSAEPVVTETVEYRDTGIILKVTPHINDRGLVTLDVSQEVSEQSDKVATGSSNPIFLKRSAQTSMVVQDGQSVIIGGLIKETWSKGKSGLPILSRIPIMGALFGYQKKTLNRSELMILLSPHVITNVEEADLITQEFREKLSIIKNQKLR